MSQINDHKKRIQEHLDELQEAVNIGIEKKPVTVGFHASACAIELLEMYLHLTKLISTGKKINHTWFKRPKPGQRIEPLVERKLPVSFPEKEKLYEFIYAIEDSRDNLIYGRPRKGEVEAVFEAFQNLRKLLEKKIEERGESIE